MQSAGGLLLSSEEAALDDFLSRYGRCYAFPSAAFHALFAALVQQRLLSSAWEQSSSRQHQLRVLRAVRVLSRDPDMWGTLRGQEAGGSGGRPASPSPSPPIPHLSSLLRRLVSEHFVGGDPPYCAELLVEVVSIFKRLAEQGGAVARRLLSCQVHLLLVQLLSSRDANLLQAVLLCLINLSQLPSFLDLVLRLPCLEPLLQLMQERSSPHQILTAAATRHQAQQPSLLLLSPMPSSSSSSSSPVSSTSPASASSTLPSSPASSLRFQILAGDLLDVMCASAECRTEVRMQGGVRVLVNLLLASATDEELLMPVLRCMASLAVDEGSSRELRQLGALPLLLALLQCERRSGADDWQGPSSAISIAVCTCLTQLANDDENAYQLCRQHALLTLLQLVVLPCLAPSRPGFSAETQAHALRVLRYLYSVERNRHLFKRLFPSALFLSFVDVGHWHSALSAYYDVVERVNAADATLKEAMRAALEEARASSQLSLRHRRVVRGYVVEEVLGKGAFGVVYRVRSESGERVYAMKEISLKLLKSSSLATAEAREAEVRLQAEGVCKEVDILSQLDHPNIVRYYSSFVEGPSMFILMELVEGTSLLDHLQSLQERGVLLQEEVIWPIFIQLVLAVSYLHIDKRVVHRDLTAANVMVDPRRRAKVMDLGLALQRRAGEDALSSPVGNVAFSCPEMLQHGRYSEKADVWSLGCILYHMCTTRTPFTADNPLALVQKVVRGVYPPIPSHFSPLMHEVIRRLLTVDPAARPDILHTSFLISPLLLAQLDRVNHAAIRLEVELAHEVEGRKKDQDAWQRERQAWRKATANKGGGAAGEVAAALAPLPLLSIPSTALVLTSPPAEAALEADGSSAIEHSGGTDGTDCSSAASSPSSSSTAVVFPLSPPPPAAPVMSSSSPPPASSRQSCVVSVSVTSVREVCDPVSALLDQLHKLVWVSQLPPRTSKDAKRSLITRYKTALFRQPHHLTHLKAELQSLLTLQNTAIETHLNNRQPSSSSSEAAVSDSSTVGPAGATQLPAAEGGPSTATSLASPSAASSSASSSSSSASSSSSPLLDSGAAWELPRRVTHEDAHFIIEQILREEGYYNQAQQPQAALDVNTPSAAAAHEQRSSTDPTAVGDSGDCSEGEVGGSKAACKPWRGRAGQEGQLRFAGGSCRRLAASRWELHEEGSRSARQGESRGDGVEERKEELRPAATGSSDDGCQRAASGSSGSNPVLPPSSPLSARGGAKVGAPARVSAEELRRRGGRAVDVEVGESKEREVVLERDVGLPASSPQQRRPFSLEKGERRSVSTRTLAGVDAASPKALDRRAAQEQLGRLGQALPTTGPSVRPSSSPRMPPTSPPSTRRLPAAAAAADVDITAAPHRTALAGSRPSSAHAASRRSRRSVRPAPPPPVLASPSSTSSLPPPLSFAPLPPPPGTTEAAERRAAPAASRNLFSRPQQHT